MQYIKLFAALKILFLFVLKFYLTVHASINKIFCIIYLVSKYFSSNSYLPNLPMYNTFAVSKTLKHYVCFFYINALFFPQNQQMLHTGNPSILEILFIHQWCTTTLCTKWANTFLLSVSGNYLLTSMYLQIF